VTRDDLGRLRDTYDAAEPSLPDGVVMQDVRERGHRGRRSIEVDASDDSRDPGTPGLRRRDDHDAVWSPPAPG
jgi:hypothetical protein